MPVFQSPGETRYESMGVPVANFAPGGLLTTSNFDAAIRAAILYAYTLTGSPDSTIDGTERYSGIHVLIPPGQWPVNDTLRFPATYPKYTPGLVGLGDIGSVTLLFNENTLTGPTIWCGNEVVGGELTNYTYRQVMRNIEIRFVGDTSYHGGIRNRFSLHAHWEDFNIGGIFNLRQAKYSFGDWEKRIGLDFGTMSSGYNHQHLSLTRVGAWGCLVGMRLGQGTWTCTAQELNLDGARLTSLMVDGGAAISWHGGSAQGGFGVGANANDPHYGAKGSIVSTGVDTLIASGTGASLAVTDGTYSTLTGLTGLIGFDRTSHGSHKLCWLEIENSGYTSGFDRVGGLYRISDVLSATSLRVWKGSGHSAVTGTINWRLYGATGAQNVSLRNVYYEGGANDAHAYLAVGSHESLPGRGYWNIEGCWAWGPTYAVRASSINADIRFVRSNSWYEGIYAERSRFSTFETDLELRKHRVDSVSRAGLVCRADKQATENGPGYIWDSHPRAVRLDRCLKERGAVWAIDARKSATIARSGANVTTWTDFIGGVVGNRINAGVAPQYNAADTGFSGPVVTINQSGGAAGLAGLTWNLTSLFPAGKFYVPTLLLIGRLQSATATTGKNMTLLAGTTYNGTIVLNDGGWYPSGWYSTFWTNDLGTSVAGGAAVPADVSPHAIITAPIMAGTAGQMGPLGCISDTAELGSGYASAGGLGPTGENGFMGGVTVTLNFPHFVGGTGGEFHAVYAAVFADALTAIEARYIIDLARNEFRTLVQAQ